jgi:hypothetical protein
MATFALRMAQDVGQMNAALQQTISTMGGVAEGVRTFLDLAKQAVVIPQGTTRDVITPGGVTEVTTTPIVPPPFDVPTISTSRSDTQRIVDAINGLTSTMSSSTGGSASATIRVNGGL